MKATEFCYWLQGFFEISSLDKSILNQTSFSSEQVEMIKRHLDMVFVHDIDKSYPEGQQKALDEAHNDPNYYVNKLKKPVAIVRC